MKDKIMLWCVMLMVLILAGIMMWSGVQFMEVRSELARIEAEGIEQCYMIECEFNIFKVNCHQTPVPEYDIGYWGRLNESFRINKTEGEIR